MSPDTGPMQNRTARRSGRLLRSLGALAAALVCALLLAGTARAWTELPEEGLAGLTPEQRTLIEALPEADRPLCYCCLTGTDVLTFFKQYSGYADLMDREGLKSVYPVGRYINGTRHPDFSTPEGQLEKQFLFELYFGLFGEFGSYTDLTRSSVSTAYSDPLQNRSLEELQTLRESLDTGRVFWPEEMPMWKSIVDAWIVYRGGTPESQIYGAEREFFNLYSQAAYVPLEGDEAQLLEEMPEVYKLLTYASFTGTDGLGWLRENSPVDSAFIQQYWDTRYQDLQTDFAEVAKTYGTDSDEAMFLLQLFGLRTDHYVWLYAGTWGIEYRDTIRIQNLPRSGDKLMDSMETVKEYLDRNSASIFWDELGSDMGQACRAWIAYFRRIAPEAVGREWDRRAEAAAYAARVAGLDWEEIQEKSEEYRRETGAYALPAVTELPADEGLAETEREFLGNVAPRYLPQAYRYLRPSLSTEEVFAACLRREYAEAGGELLGLSRSGLEEEYLRLAAKAALEGLEEAEAARLELCAELLLCRLLEEGQPAFGGLLIDYDRKKADWAVSYPTEGSDPLEIFHYDTLVKLAERRRTQGDPRLLNDVLCARNFDALAGFKRERKLLPEMDALGRRVYDATAPDMQVYAAAIVSGLLEPNHDLIYAETPEQLWQRREKDDVGGMSYTVLASLLAAYGMPDFHETDHPSYYTASDGALEEIVGSVNQYVPEAIEEARRILWHRRGEFYSAAGNYHARLGRMSARELFAYREELESGYYAAADDQVISELSGWIEQVNAWLAWRNEWEKAAPYTEGTDAEGVWTGTASDLDVRASERTYILELATGRVPGESIEFFRIIYETEEGDTRTQYIFPTEDSLRVGYRMAAQAGTPQTVLDWVGTVVGYDTADPLNSDSLQSFHTDQFLFVADGAIKSVTEIQAFMRRDAAEGKNEWTCSGLRLYKVDALQGLQRYGIYSSDCYIDFSGSLLAELRFEDESFQNVSWRGSDTLFRFGGEAGAYGYSLGTDSGSRSIQSTAANVIFRVDLADQYLAGLECLSTGYQGSNSKSISRPGNLCEALTLQVRYRDVYGGVRDAALPVVCSTAAWSVLEGGVSGIQDYAGLGQQGESLAFAGTLPDLAEVLYVTPVLGGDAAAAAAGLTPAKEMPAAVLRDGRIAQSNGETAGILASAVYDGARGKLRARYEDSFLRFDFPSMPEKYYRAPDITGLRLDAGGAAGQLALETYAEGSRLLPVDRQERYLVTVYTDDAELAGTVSDVLLRLSYEDVDGNKKQTPEFSLRDYAGDYYGYWPASAEDFGYLYGLSSSRDTGYARGQSLSVLLPVQDVQKFTDVTIRIASHAGEEIDEWQMKDLTVQTVGSIGPRRIDWRRVTASGEETFSDRVISRDVAGNIIFTLSRGGDGDGDTDPDRDGPFAAPEKVFEPELFQDGEPVTIDITTPDVVERPDVDWRSLKYNMTFADTMQDLGFLKPRASYTVQVKVASNAGSSVGEDDCGSVNQFYFQLLFAQGGKSAVVLANQQLQSDGFHAGSTETFTITVSQEYGELSGIRIIPEDIASDSNKYDKLKIETITVIQNGDGQLSPLWRFRDVGWIGIDYRDEGEENSLSGVTARTMDEISRVYNVSESSYAVNVQVAVSTGQYKDRKGEAVEQFQGGMSAEITYRDVNGVIQRQNIEDVVALMYAFNNRPAQYSTVQNNGVFTTGQAVSDPNYMFRPNHTDRFILSLDGLEQILNLKLYPRSSVNTVWNVSDVNVSLVRGQGRRILNVAGEYTMKYPEGQELLPIACSDSTGEPKYSKQLYITGAEGSAGSPVTVNFTSEKVRTDTSLFETQTLVTPLPAGGNDSFNFVVYPTTLSGVGINGYDLTVSIRYTTAADTIVQNSARMNKTTADGEPMFYLEGLTAPGLVQLNSISFKSSLTTGSGITGGFVQRVRGSFAVETYELGAVSGLEHGAEAPFVGTDAERELLCFQLGTEMPETRLKNGVNDVAVSLHYRTDGPGGREVQSRRYFLTEEGCSALRAGQLVELEFRESHVAEITGVSFIPTGQVSLDLGDAFVTCSRTDAGGALSETGRYSFAEAAAGPASGVIRRNVSSDAREGAGSVQPVYLRFATGSRQDNAGAGIDSPVRLTLGCIGSVGVLEERTYPDIRPYIQNGNRSFPADEETEVVLLAEDVQSIRWAELTVLPEDGGQLAIWNLRSLTLRLGDSGQQLKRELSGSLPEGETRRLSFANVYITGELTYPLEPRTEEGPAEGETSAPVTVRVGGGETGILLGSGQGIRVDPTVSGSSEGFGIELLSLEPTIGVTGQPSLSSAHSYTERYLEELEKEAKEITETGSESEASAARRVLEIIPEITESRGSFSSDSLGATFMAPRNFTGSGLYYRLIVTSRETGDTAFTVDLTVQSEADPLGEAITALRTVQNNELLQKMNEGLASIGSSAPTDGASAGGDTAGGASADGDTADGASADGEPIDEEPIDEEPIDEEPIDEEPAYEEPDWEEMPANAEDEESPGGESAEAYTEETPVPAEDAYNAPESAAPPEGGMEGGPEEA